MIKRLTRVTQGYETMVAKTKGDPNVGYYGFTPKCASFFVKGHYQEYADVFVKIEPMVQEYWNQYTSSSEHSKPE